MCDQKEGIYIFGNVEIYERYAKENLICEIPMPPILKVWKMLF